jgi:hypothetical protein
MYSAWLSDLFIKWIKSPWYGVTSDSLMEFPPGSHALVFEFPLSFPTPHSHTAASTSHKTKYTFVNFALLTNISKLTRPLSPYCTGALLTIAFKQFLISWCQGHVLSLSLTWLPDVLGREMLQLFRSEALCCDVLLNLEENKWNYCCLIEWFETAGRSMLSLTFLFWGFRDYEDTLSCMALWRMNVCQSCVSVDWIDGLEFLTP